MLPRSHVIASAAISVIVWFYFKNLGYAVVSFITGTFIDADHFFDYSANHKFTLDLGRIYRVCADIDLPRIYLLLHSYEIMVIMWSAIILFSLGNFWKAAAIGYTQHLLLDQFTNPLTIRGYFFTYRMMKGFRKEALIHQKT